MKRRIATATLAGAALIAAAAGLWLRQQLRASLPALDGERRLPGLAAAAEVQRDGRGVPTVRAAGRVDLARATGFVHAQDRFFQMDLLRRRPAGELAELVGGAALEVDVKVRVHRLRAVAQRVVAAASAEDRAIVEAYAAGVNAGLASLAAPPFEYLALGATPAPWRPEDTVLVVLAMFLTLQDEDGRRESMLGVLYDLMPPAMADFLAPRGTEWDAPIVGEPFAVPEIPGPEVLDLRREAPPAPARAPDDPLREPEPLGSNNWAVAGRLTAHGGALLANDMHLGLGVPNIWYRASFVWRDGGGAERRVTGVTLPGTPAVVVGSNGHVAWGFTNTYGDWGDLIVLDADPADPDVYATPEGPRRLEHIRERIRVRGAPDAELDVLWSVWGPVIDRDHRGRRRVLRWVAHEPRAVNLRLTHLESARSVDEAVELANQSGVPAQNFVCADADGRIGWTVLGILPRRVGWDGRTPGSWADGRRRWDGWLAPADYPRVIDPPDGRIWTANARVVDGARLAALGDGGYVLGARARQIRDDLRALERPAEADMLRVQLDDRALFLGRWRDLLLATLSPAAIAERPARAELRRHVEAWGGRAAVDSVGYRIVRTFRALLAQEVLGALTARCRAADRRFDPRELPQGEGPLWALLTRQPAHLLSPRHASWPAQILAAADATAESLLRGGALEQRTWGERNTVRVRHPLSRALPWLGRWLDVPPQPLPGDSHMPRFQSPDSGASERMAVSPGREEQGLFHMPAGQSGHPLSPHYYDGHGAWADGAATPFLPGPPVHTLRLSP